MSKIVQEFREFIARGNVVDLAVGVIIGAAFGKIVTSLVNDLVMPPIGVLLGKVDFKTLFISLHGHFDTLADADAAKAPVIRYGQFINTILEFLIVAACVFAMVKTVNRFKRTEAAVPTAPTKTEQLLEEIRDELKKE